MKNKEKIHEKTLKIRRNNNNNNKIWKKKSEAKKKETKTRKYKEQYCGYKIYYNQMLTPHLISLSVNR